MATTKDSEEVEKKTEKVAVVAAQPQATEQSKSKKPESRQTILILAAVSAVVMLFIGFGLGYLLGHSSTSRTFPTDRMRFRDDDGGRRFYPNSSTKDTTGSGSSSTTTPGTQSN